MRQVGPFIPSYSLSSMSVRELQRAATGPQRRKRIPHAKAVPHADADLANGTHLNPKLLRRCDVHYDCIHLVPGGRFVVTLKIEQDDHDGDVSSLTVVLWDNGPPGDASYTQMIPILRHTSASGVLDLVHKLCCRLRVSVARESCLRVAVPYPVPPSSALEPPFSRYC
ncbi:hypothetical protein FA13DRAFT_87032 [Coprinellus micaceus]|uniref:Uncharacterized protein n=1 Tax=Coprinellus micaceus TaxID=71717 RepID=A0A4Y7SKW5_COPMI|nr:hypothetical protein FA13DRAFT_87032 [Coprinellus micaceus]